MRTCTAPSRLVLALILLPLACSTPAKRLPGASAVSVPAPVVADAPAPPAPLPAAADDPPAPGTPEHVRWEGRRLLVEERWDEAGEHYGARYASDNPLIEEPDRISLWEEVEAVLDAHDDRPPAERDLYRMKLVAWHFRHESLWVTYLRRFDRDRYGYRGARDGEPEEGYDFEGLRRLAARYARWAARVPGDADVERLDFSHIDLLEDLAVVAEDGSHTDELRSRAEAALFENPESIPATLGQHFLLWDAEEYDEVLEKIRGRLVAPLGALALARWESRDPYPEDPASIELLRIGETLAPSREEKAFFRGWLAYLAPEEDREQALLETFASYPDTRYGQAALVRVVDDLSEAGHPDAALRRVRALQADGWRGTPLADRCLYTIALSIVGGRPADEEEAWARARPLLLEVADRSSEWSGWSSRAHVALAWYHDERGEALEHRRRLEAAIAREPCDPEVGWELAPIYEREGRWEEAWRTWERTGPRDSFCGNAVASDYRELSEARARCGAAIGRGAEAVETLARLWREPIWLDLGPSEVGVSIYRLYRDAAQIEDLRRSVASSLTTGDAYPFEDLLAIHELLEEGDVPGLIDLCNDPRRGPAPKYARYRECETVEEGVELLVRTGQSAVGPLLRALLDEAAASEAFIRALGRIDHPDAYQALEALSWRRPPDEDDEFWGLDDWPIYLPWRCVDRYGEALAGHGEKGRALLERLAAEPEGPLVEMATKWLRLIREGHRPPETRIPVAPGSLPRDLDLSRAEDR